MILQSCRQVNAKSHPEWIESAVIYEINIRQFTQNGTFEEASLQLPRLKELGVDVLWLMPIFPIGVKDRKGSLGSYYSIQDYLAINSEFGTIQDFQYFVDLAHDLGMKVILDWVPNHTSRDAVWLNKHADWYVWDNLHDSPSIPFDWSDTAQLDYSNPQMRSAMQDAMAYWVQNHDIDGFRVDMAMLVPIDFWQQTSARLLAIRSDIFLLAEAEGVEFFDSAFDCCYAWELYHAMEAMINNVTAADYLRSVIISNSILYPHSALKLLFTSNHDENSWHGSEHTRFNQARLAFAALTFVLPGIPLIYNGQEYGLDQQLSFFDHDPINWQQHDQQTINIYSDLIKLRHSHPALRSGLGRGGDLQEISCTESHRIFAVKREVADRRIVAVFNFSAHEANVQFFDPCFDGQYSQIGSEDLAYLRGEATDFYLPAWGWYIYYI